MLTYDSFVTSVANLLVVPSTDAHFLTVLPNIIDDAEGRIYRDCDFLRTINRDSTVLLSTATRNVSLSTSVDWLVIESVNVYYQSTASNSSMRAPLTQVSRDYIDAVYPQETSNSTGTRPTCWAPITDQQFIVGPPAGSPYRLEIIGTTRPQALSSGNSSTYLTQHYSELFLIAGCLFGAAYLKNFGAAVDDPRSGVTWAQAYQVTLQGVVGEEQRRRHQGPAWSPKSPAPLTESPRV